MSDSHPHTAVPRKAAAYGACLLAVFMLTVDMTIVTVALPVLSHQLSATPSAQLLMISGYSASYGCALLAAGWVGQSFGRRRTFSAAVFAFAAASMWCACASSATELVVARVAQGLSGAVVIAQVTAIVVGLVPGEKYDRAFSGVLVTGALAAISGPLLGGLLISVDLFGLGWRSVFLINVPVSIVVVGVAWRSLPSDGRSLGSGGRPDIPGLALSTVGVLALLDALLRTPGERPVLETAAEFSSAVVILTLFIMWQIRAGGRGRRTVVRIHLFRDRSFALGTALTAGLFGMFTALVFVLTITMQEVLGFSPLRSALFSTPFATGAIAGAVAAPNLMAKYGVRAPAAGMGVVGLCLVAFAAYLGDVGRGIDLVLILVPTLLAGAGYGLFTAPLQAMTLRRLGADDAGSVSGLLPVMEQIGSAVGLTAVASLVFRSHTLDGSVAAVSVLAATALALAGLCLLVPERHQAMPGTVRPVGVDTQFLDDWMRRAE